MRSFFFKGGRTKNMDYNRRSKSVCLFSGYTLFNFFSEVCGLAKRENSFQESLIREIKERFLDVIILKNDSSYIQGIPDLLVLWRDRWACLECKRSVNAHHQPNQEWYVNRMNSMSFARFIYPENKEEVLNEMEQAFQS